MTAAIGGRVQTIKFSGAHTSISALLDPSEVRPGVSGPVCLPLLRFFRSPSTLPRPRLDVGSTVLLVVSVVTHIITSLSPNYAF